MNAEPQETRKIAELERSVSELRLLLRRIQAEREEQARRSRRRMLTLGVGVSVLAHLILLFYLATVTREPGGAWAGPPEGYEIAILPLEHLSDLDELSFDDLIDEPLDDLTFETLETTALAEAASPAGELEAAGDESLPAIGGSGGGEARDGGLGGAGTTYFGVAARGTRFAYIVDRSGSMMHRNRMEIAMTELIRSIEALPDYTYFRIILFSSDMMQPPIQRAGSGGGGGWVQARRSNVHQVTRWLRSVSPGGGTLPRSSFQEIFAMSVRPDVIYFMTDGIIEPGNLSAEEVAEQNQRGRRVIINTIAFGDDGSEELLRRIARESGGVYRYVPDGGGR